MYLLNFVKGLSVSYALPISYITYLLSLSDAHDPAAGRPVIEASEQTT